MAWSRTSSDADAVRRLLLDLAPDTVYNLAGISSVAQSWEQPGLTTRLSGVAALELMETAHRLQETTGRQVRFVQAASAEIFGDADVSPQDESTPIRPVNPYGAAKALAHVATHVYRQRDLHAVSCILYNHESPRRPPGFVTRKITRGAVAIARGRLDRLTLGNLDARRDWGWAPDYVDAMVRAGHTTSPRTTWSPPVLPAASATSWPRPSPGSASRTGRTWSRSTRPWCARPTPPTSVATPRVPARARLAADRDLRGAGWPDGRRRPRAGLAMRTPDAIRPRVAIAHDYLTQRGGAERVVLALHRASGTRGPWRARRARPRRAVSGSRARWRPGDGHRCPHGRPLEVGVDHPADELVEGDGRRPAEHAPAPRGVADLHVSASAGRTKAGSTSTRAPSPSTPAAANAAATKSRTRMRHAGRDDVVVGHVVRARRAPSRRRSPAPSPSRAGRRGCRASAGPAGPAAIAAAPRGDLAGDEGGRAGAATRGCRGCSSTACSPRCGRPPAIWWANALAAPYGVTGRIGVASSCGDTSASPKISALDGLQNRTCRPVAPAAGAAASISASAATPLTSRGEDRVLPGLRHRADAGQVVDARPGDQVERAAGARRRRRPGRPRAATTPSGTRVARRSLGVHQPVHLDALGEQPLGEVAAVLPGDAGDEAAHGHRPSTARCCGQVVVDHHRDQLGNADRGLPAEHGRAPWSRRRSAGRPRRDA